MNIRMNLLGFSAGTDSNHKFESNDMEKKKGTRKGRAGVMIFPDMDTDIITAIISNKIENTSVLISNFLFDNIYFFLKKSLITI